MVAQVVEQEQLITRLDRLHAAVAAIPLQAYGDLSPAQARRAAARTRELVSMLRTHAGAAVRAVERLVSTRDTRQLLAGDFGLDAGAAHRELKDARALAGAPAAERAAAVGQITQAHAVVIGSALRHLPEAASAEQHRLAEQQLISDAARLSQRPGDTGSADHRTV